MQQPRLRLLFDRNDQQLLVMLNHVLSREKSSKALKNLLNPYLNPHGIKELAAPQGLRIAYAMINFLDSLEAGKAHERVSALRSVRDEVLNVTRSPLRNNTARVLLQIMKELVRTRDDRRRQLELAHDFRTARSGKPRVIRALLHRYHLLEMPEAWNQIAFDDHVHDANTKGRKSPTHLIMDAWIKGIRHLTVIHYNYIEPEAAAELLEAADIMRMTIRIGVSLSARFRDHFVPFIWVPRGFADTGDFLNFLAEKHVMDFMAEGRKVSEYRATCVLAAMQAFNDRHRFDIQNKFVVKIPLLEEKAFLSFVGGGQVSNLHLAEFIHQHLLPAMQIRLADLRKQHTRANAGERLRIERLVEEMNALDSEAVVERYLRPACNPDLPNPNIPRDDFDEPALLKMTPLNLMNRLRELHPSCRITLSPGGLTDADVLEILYDCQGMITHLEVFNLKDYAAGKTVISREMNELQLALNEGNVIALKRVILGVIRQQEGSDGPSPEQIKKLRDILHNIPRLKSYYKQSPLRARIGSDSTGRSHHLQGMGLAIRETLPPHAQKELQHFTGPHGEMIPVVTCAYLRETFIPRESGSAWVNAFYRLARILPGMHLVGQRRREEWVKQNYSTRLEAPGNITTLSALREEGGNAMTLEEPPPPSAQPGFSWKYLNSHLKAGMKIAFGFLPAFLTFYLSKDWWVLAYGGAFIWFGITGLRNIIQSVLGGGGLRRTPLLHWKDYVSWERLADSLMFTGFSVPLLDYFTKTLLLERLLGITTASNPFVLYAVIALVNGLYLSGHNAFRGLPRAAVVGNAFRSILSIPLAIVFNAGIGMILTMAGISGVNGILQQWAAVISKIASDSVAAVIEGLADRLDNMRMRARDYAGKLPQLFDVYARMEMLLPETDVLSLLATPAGMINAMNSEARDLEKIMIINALDLMYFWMYQPRAQKILRERLNKMSAEEKKILLRSQFILSRRREMDQMFHDGLIGRNYKLALAFYHARHKEYLSAMIKMITD
ncbi:MAG: hypothetical protein NTZ57_06795 [Deltaproteobacteria bacterium]|nr:hypothetical protein [Deltaproteobacteria bacterium]